MIRRLRPGDETLLPRAREPALLDDPRLLVVVALDGEARAGFAYAHLLPRLDGGRAVFLYELEVEERFRRRGHGRALVAEVLAWAAEQGAAKTWVQASPGNEAANALYASCGAERSAEADVLWTWRAAASR